MAEKNGRGESKPTPAPVELPKVWTLCLCGPETGVGVSSFTLRCPEHDATKTTGGTHFEAVVVAKC